MRWRVASSYGAGDEAAGPLADAEAGAGGRGVSRGVAIGDVSNAVGDADARPLALDAGSAPRAARRPLALFALASLLASAGVFALARGPGGVLGASPGVPSPPATSALEASRARFLAASRDAAPLRGLPHPFLGAFLPGDGPQGLTDIGCDGHCPPAPARTWNVVSDVGSAHVLLLGDSTDKLWHIQLCNSFLPENQRCVANQCTVRTGARALPNNMQPFVCAEGEGGASESRCAASTCYPSAAGGPPEPCWTTPEANSAAACKPRVPSGPVAGFVHTFNADPDHEGLSDVQAAQLGVETAGVLPTRVRDRVPIAVASFAAFTQKRPMVFVVDVNFWWSFNRFIPTADDDGNKADPIVSKCIAAQMSGGQVPSPAQCWEHRWRDSVGDQSSFDQYLAAYERDMRQFVRLLEDSAKRTGRAFVIVGKNAHDPGFTPGTPSARWHYASGEAMRKVFTSEGHHFYDWAAVAEHAAKTGEWDWLDGAHQGASGSAYQTAAFVQWTRSALSRPFWVYVPGLTVTLTPEQAEREIAAGTSGGAGAVVAAVYASEVATQTQLDDEAVGSPGGDTGGASGGWEGGRAVVSGDGGGGGGEADGSGAAEEGAGAESAGRAAIAARKAQARSPAEEEAWQKQQEVWLAQQKEWAKQQAWIQAQKSSGGNV